MKKIICLIVYLIFSTNNYGQSGWVALNTQIKFPLLQLQAVDSENVYACGLNGTMIRSTNSGINWSGSAGGTNYFNLSLSFVNINTGYLVNFSDTIGSKIYKTTNGSQQWFKIYENTDLYLLSIYFVSDLIGWCGDASGSVMKTTDGGLTWSSQLILYSFAVWSIKFVDSSTGWLGMTGSIYKTTNSGMNWTAQVTPTGSNNVNDLFFLSSLNGYSATSGGYILHTTNGGTNWNIQQTASGFNTKSIYFTSASTGWAVGEYGRVYYTSNAGNTWIFRNDFPKLSYESVYFINQNTGYIAGEFGTIYKTTTGGF